MAADTRVLDAGIGAPEDLDALIRRAQAGEESAFESILDQFESRAILIARGMGASRADAEDIAQDAFLKVFRYIRSYRSDRTFRAYFYRIVINACRDHFSRMRPSGQAPLEDAGEITAPPDTRVPFDEVERLHRALQELPPREREVVLLRDLQGISTWEVARILRISPITVRRHSSRALTHLKKLLAPPTGTS